MNNKKVSVIIPARNEEKIIQKTIESYKKQEYYPLEIIVVVNNSTDQTYKISSKYADKVLDFSGRIGTSAARNEGVKIATGNIFIFSDADSYLSKGAIKKIVDLIDKNTIGTPLGKGDNDRFGSKLFFFYKNWTHRLRIYKGIIDGVFFCHREIFLKTGGFDKLKKIVEFEDFIKRAKKNKARYKLFTNCYAITSLRRYEEKGYLNNYIFWIKWRIASIFKKEKKLTEKYFN